jgi:hypothetical protein
VLPSNLNRCRPPCTQCQSKRSDLLVINLVEACWCYEPSKPAGMITFSKCMAAMMLAPHATKCLHGKALQTKL